MKTDPQSDTRIPVTVLTGFLGSGKTTLLNRILTEQHGRRIAVIENEFGEVGVDHELVVGADEEIFEMNNGCICCTVRGDLIRILGNLLRRKDRLDAILIETTGMADPGPVAQTFVMDEDLRDRLRLDGIVTLVDARHTPRHLDEGSDEASRQIAFADVLLLNKADLVTPAELDRLEERLRRMNARAVVHRTHKAELPLDRILGIHGFDVRKALEVDPLFLEPEYPFEWGGLFALEAGVYTLAMEPGPDPSMQIALLPATGTDQAALDKAREVAVSVFSDRSGQQTAGETLSPGRTLLTLEIGDHARRWRIELAAPQAVGLFTQHHPEEFSLRLQDEAGATLPVRRSQVFKPDHEHDDEVGSVGLKLDGELDLKRLNTWLGELLNAKGPDLFRSKGVLNVQGLPNRVVFQGVHMLFDISVDRPWGNQKRHSVVVFIGRNLDRAALEAGLRQCLA